MCWRLTSPQSCKILKMPRFVLWPCNSGQFLRGRNITSNPTRIWISLSRDNSETSSYKLYCKTFALSKKPMRKPTVLVNRPLPPFRPYLRITRHSSSKRSLVLQKTRFTTRTGSTGRPASDPSPACCWVWMSSVPKLWWTVPWCSW